MKKLLSLLLAITMIATMIPAVALSAVAQTSDTLPDNAITVSTKAEFLAYFDGTESDTDKDGDLDKNLILGADIDMGGQDITAVVATLDNVIIDGDGHTIHNFTMTGTGTSFSLFNVVENSSLTIRNVTMGTSAKKIAYTFAPTAHKSNAGLFLSVATCNTSFENVTVYIDMKNETNYTSSMGGFASKVVGAQSYQNVTAIGSIQTKGDNGVPMGGFVAYIAPGSTGDVSFENCTNYVTITNINSTAARQMGGFVGLLNHDGDVNFENCKNYGSISGGNMWIGGLVGNTQPTANVKSSWVFRSCVNYGVISGSGAQGGLIGYARLDTAKPTSGAGHTFENCTNYGEVSSTGDSIGGLIGTTYSKNNSTKALSFDNCVNYANVKGNKTGGFIGYTQLSGGCSIIDCANLGDISGVNIGGAIGYDQPQAGGTASVEITNFINLGTIASTNYAGGLVGFIRTNGAATTYTVEGTVNFGTLTSTNAKAGVAGFIGSDYPETSAKGCSFTIKNSMNAGAVSANGGTKIGAFIGEGANAENVTAETENNTYVSDAALNTIGGTTALETLNAAMEKYNDGTSFKGVFDIHGKVMLNDKGDCAVLATPALVGVQKTNALADDGTYSIRLVSVIDVARYSKVGYKIQVNDAAEMPIYCTTAYTGISETVNGQVNTYTASTLGGTYVYALNVDELDPNETYTFTVTPVAFGTEADGATEYVGETYTFVYANGIFGGFIENSEV